MKQWEPPAWWKAVILLTLSQIMLGVIYGVWFGPCLGLEILWYLGLVVLPFGAFFIFWGPLKLRKKAGSIDRPKALVESGPFAVVRHPQYLGAMLLMSASILISQHWLSTIIGVLMMVLIYAETPSEEQYLIEQFGDDYRRYMGRVPRMNPLVGVIRQLQRRRRES